MAMNGRPDEPLDQWVRQSLDRLPDAPPPGTTFDAERLWTHIRPELKKTTHRRQRGWVWWAAAACLVGAVLGWLSLNQQSPERSRADIHAKYPDAPMAINREPQNPAGFDRTERRLVRKNRSSEPSSVRNTEPSAPVPTPVLSTKAVAESVTRATEPLTGADVDSTALMATDVVKATVVSAPKRRFQVVHLNELRAEEEIRPAPYRTERFVRLGLGNNGQLIPETAHPSITWSITNKPTQ